MNNKTGIFGVLLMVPVMLTFLNTGSQKHTNTTPAHKHTTGISSLAFRVHNMEAMKAFYSEAFGVEFREVQTGAFNSKFGELGNITLKFVPIREESEFETYPIHQPGIDVEDIAEIIKIAIKHGGAVENELQENEGMLYAAVRDPDGNTIELYSKTK